MKKKNMNFEVICFVIIILLSYLIINTISQNNVIVNNITNNNTIEYKVDYIINDYTNEDLTGIIEDLNARLMAIKDDVDAKKATDDNLMAQANELINKNNANNLFLKAYPVNSIYISYSSTNPGTIFGGTWEAFGTGRALAGINTSDSDFETLGKTGGAKTVTLTTSTIPSHTHTFTGTAHSHKPSNTSTSFIGAKKGLDPGRNGTKRSWWTNSGTADKHYIYFTVTTTGVGEYANTSSVTVGGSNANTGGGGAHNNLQPYVTVYMWKRTA